MGTLLILGWIAWTLACGFVAHHRGRSALAWGLLALFFSPLLAYLVLVAIPVESRSPRASATPRWLDSGDDSPIFKNER